ncbi:MAG: hypothetical protein A2W01_12580 [Candidatus Solincola sediminis]|uniref:AB hydrolase-1 domain-containing protein n=1 Tax=Candidatus Solincola sediminis TaxID=1797199 RepID=A0A1F2WK87_9ACTN|nr:MAG: hypothetical protein A2W01_12580 [Candidatus Solincola sediminis]OFW57234.1 MAG: hypothetical protein A2Y75_07325 [Candidatus Solincola sediminis]
MMLDYEEALRNIRSLSYILWASARHALWAARPNTKTETGRIQVGDISIFFRRFGSGPPVLLLHGGFSFSQSWAGQIRTLASDYEVIAMDSRGHGHTTLGSKPMTYRQMAEEAAGVIEGLHLGPVDLIGWSDGGCTSLALSLEHPDLVRSMVLIGTPFNVSNYDGEALRRIEMIMKPGSMSLFGIRIMQRLMNPEPHRARDFIDEMRRMWNTLPDFTLEDLAKIDIPTLVIACDCDEFLSHNPDPYEVFREMAEAMPQACIATVEGGTHTVHIEKPERINRLLSDFLCRV